MQFLIKNLVIFYLFVGFFCSLFIIMYYLVLFRVIVVEMNCYVYIFYHRPFFFFYFYVFNIKKINKLLNTFNFRKLIFVCLKGINWPKETLFVVVLAPKEQLICCSSRFFLLIIIKIDFINMRVNLLLSVTN